MDEYTHSATSLWTEIALEGWAEDSSSNSSTPVVLEEYASLADLPVEEQSTSFQELVEPLLESDNGLEFSAEAWSIAYSLTYHRAENEVLTATRYMRSSFEADIAASALEYFVGEPYEDAPHLKKQI